MGRPVMPPIAPTGLSWDERLDIRKHALEQAARYCGARGIGLTSKTVIETAQAFERYLRGEDNG